MKKSFKLALLGCASTCLMGAAYANEKAPDRVSIENLNVEDMVCGAEKRTYHFDIKNNGFKPVFLGPLFVDIDEDDSFPENRYAVHADKSCFRLGAFATCKGELTIDPELLKCAKEDHPLVFDADIERTLIAPYFAFDDDDGPSAEHIRFARAEIDADVNLLGSLNDYAMIAGSIIAGDDSFSVLDSITTVEGNVSAVDNHITDGDDIAYNCEYGTCGYVHYPDSQGAFADAAQAWEVFRAAVGDVGVDDKLVLDCTDSNYTLEVDYHGFNEVYPNFYCGTTDHFTFTSADDGTAAVIDVAQYDIHDGAEVAFKGDEDDVFIIAFPDTFTCGGVNEVTCPTASCTRPGATTLATSCATAGVECLYATSATTGTLCPITSSTTFDILASNFDIHHGARFSLTSDAVGTTVDNRNIFWVFPEDDGVITFHHDSRFAGNILTASSNATDPSITYFDYTTPEPGSSPYIMGGLYGLDLDAISAEDCLTSSCNTEIDVNGFYIDSDSNDD